MKTYWLLVPGLCFLFANMSYCQEIESPCNPQRWEKVIAKFEATDAKAAPSQQGILFVGSSSIRLWDLPKHFPQLQPTNHGFGGSEICDSTHYAEQLIFKHKPQIVVLYAGDNDVARGKSAEQVHHDFTAFTKKLHGALPETRLVYIAIKPSLARWKLASTMQEANRRIAVDCQKNKRLSFVDIWPPMLNQNGQPRKELFAKDGLHLNAQGYELWTELLRPHLLGADKP